MGLGKDSPAVPGWDLMQLRPVVLALVLLVGLGELAANVHHRASGPTSEDVTRASQVIGEFRAPEAALVVAPSWPEPLLRQALGVDSPPLDKLGRADDDSLLRVIEVSWDGHRDPRYLGWSEVRQERTSQFEIRLLDNPRPAPVKMRLLDRVRSPLLEVREGKAGDPRLCGYTERARVITGGLGGEPTLGARRFECPSGPPHLVTVTTIDDQSFEPRRCIFASPAPREPLTLTFRDVVLGQRFVGHAGFPWLLSRDGGPAVRLRATLEGVPLAELEIAQDAGWRRFEWPLAGHEDRVADLELEISVAEAGPARFCFALESR